MTTCTIASHAADKSRRAPHLVFQAFQLDENGEALIAYIHCRICHSTLACEPDDWSAFAERRVA